MNQTASNPEILLRRMQSLADPIRLRLLHLLEHNELTVAELCDILQLPQSTVSRHLKVLSDEAWARGRRQATTHLYRTLLDELDPAARRLWVLTREQTENWAAVRQDELRLGRVLRQRQTDSESFFAGAAAEWDRLRLEMYGPAFTRQAMLALLPSDYVVADLGCGTGEVAQQLSHHVRRVIGVDNSAAMLKAARKRTIGQANVELRRGELSSIPIEPGSCDAALLILVLSYVEDAAVALREARRILKSNGRAVIVDVMVHDRDDFRRLMNQRHSGFAPDGLRSMLAESGFSHTVIVPLPSEPDVKGPALFLATAQNS